MVQIGRRLEISFTPPADATDGERLTKPLEVQIFRRVTPPGQAKSRVPTVRAQGSPTPARREPRRAAATSGPWVSLQAAEVRNLARGQKIVYSDRLSDQQLTQSSGATLTFRVRSLTRGFRGRPIESEFSNAVEITVLDVSGPVEKLQVLPTEKALELRWSPPNQTRSERQVSELAGYHVYRSQTGKPDSFQLVGEASNLMFLDTHFEFGRTYFHKVRAVFKQDDQMAESEDSGVVEITPRDVFPPAAPAGLTGLYTAGAVELIWTASLEPDLAGYNVYRREEGRPLQQINKELLRTPIYRDTSVEPGRQYFYRVTATDLSGNQSLPSEEVAVEAR